MHIKKMHHKRRQQWGWIAAILTCAGLSLLFMPPRQPNTEQQPPAAMPVQQAPSNARTNASTLDVGPAPFNASALKNRQEQLTLWQERLERSHHTLEVYRESSRYPHESQPLSVHHDQMYPHQLIVEERPFRTTGNSKEKLKLRTTQERVFVQARESVRFTVAGYNSTGETAPLQVIRAIAYEVPGPGKASNYPEVSISFNDEGKMGDETASDGIYSTQLQPAVQGFADLFGQIRVELFLQIDKQPEHLYFDIFFTPQAPASWEGKVREAMEDGSLNFYLKTDVHEAGRYVVTGRLDDANGKPFALLTFNEEVAVGEQEFRLNLFGKLVRDFQPVFPLTLRDVDAFLLRPDTFPDRSLMQRLVGKVHTSHDYPLISFSSNEWSSEKRTRYLNELTRDVTKAQMQVESLSSHQQKHY